MVNRTLSAALIALLLTTPIAAAWCEACIQDRCDMPMATEDMPMDELTSPVAGHTGMSGHQGGADTSSNSAASSHCAEMAKASTSTAHEAAAPAPGSHSAAPVNSCCVDAAPNEVQLALAPTPSQMIQLDILPVTALPVTAAIVATHGSADVDWTPRPPPRPLFTLHSLLLI